MGHQRNEDDDENSEDLFAGPGDLVMRDAELLNQAESIAAMLESAFL